VGACPVPSPRDAAPQSRRADLPGRHGHLWFLPDGTGLHAPVGSLVAEEGTGRLCCHLCGEWFTALGVHVRVHGYTAGTYRERMGLPRACALVAAGLPAPAGEPQAVGRAAAARRRRQPPRGPADGGADAGQAGAGDRYRWLREHRSEGWTIALRAPGLMTAAPTGREPVPPPRSPVVRASSPS